MIQPFNLHPSPFPANPHPSIYTHPQPSPSPSPMCTLSPRRYQTWRADKGAILQSVSFAGHGHRSTPLQRAASCDRTLRSDVQQGVTQPAGGSGSRVQPAGGSGSRVQAHRHQLGRSSSLTSSPPLASATSRMSSAPSPSARHASGHSGHSGHIGARTSPRGAHLLPPLTSFQWSLVAHHLPHITHIASH